MKLRIGILTLSDTRTEAEDTAGAALKELCAERGWAVDRYSICEDEGDCIVATLTVWSDQDRLDVILTCGGTGLSQRDVTPEATRSVGQREVPGIADAIRMYSLQVTGRAMLSRGVAVMRGETLIVNLPGSRKAAVESFGFIADQLEHARDMAHGGGHA